MTKRRVHIALGAVVLLGAALRLVALAIEPAHHPDEFFQYLEPAWTRLTGAGVETWEWRQGIRSWVLPGYHGAWMALFMRLGLHDGVKLTTILQTHWALLSMLLVWAGWRGGSLLARRLSAESEESKVLAEESPAAPLGWQGGLLGSFLCAAFPLQVRFSIHTLSEPASILCLVWALVLTAELTQSKGRAEPSGKRKAIWLGVLLGLGICLRIQHVPIPLVAVLWMLFARKFRWALWACGAAILPVLAFGVVDWLTWSGFFSSFVGYVKFNLLEGGAATFGTLPFAWYWNQFLHRLPVGLPVLALLGVLGIRATWPFVISAVGLALFLSTQAHKEERFVMLFWPLVLIAAAGTAGAWLERCHRAQSSAVFVDGVKIGQRGRCTVVLRWALLAALGLVLVDGARHCGGNDFADLAPARYEAHAWIGRQEDVTGLLYDEPLFVGGYMWFGRTFPQLMFRPVLLGNPLFSHVLVRGDSEFMREAERAGFSRIFSKGEFVVLRRNAGR